MVDAKGRVLVVRPTRRRGDEWTLPKGHVEAGETIEECALREVAEEARAKCKLGPRVGEVAYTKNGEDVRCVFFRMRFVKDVDSHEDRERAWFRVDELDGKIRFVETLDVVRAAVAQ